ncbi:MAG: hypothetical protein JRJ79_10455 [Deltaproteobacteria bacterium]|nr:hypothetical protein [Deltaproteobacteria bacterium]
MRTYVIDRLKSVACLFFCFAAKQTATAPCPGIALKAKTSIAVRIPHQPAIGGCSTIKISLCSSLLDSSGIPPERKKLKAAMIRALRCH